MRKPEPRIAEIYPPVGTAVELEPEELAPFVLEYLNGAAEAGMRNMLNKNNLTVGTSDAFKKYAGEYREEFRRRLMEALIWLEKELLIAPEPPGGDQLYITRRGQKVLEKQDMASYRKGQLLPSHALDPALERDVKPLFIRGDYDTAIFRAFREVEIRVREKASYDSSMIGVTLMRKAFKPDEGPLRACLES